jgi:hypothetical protein
VICVTNSVEVEENGVGPGQRAIQVLDAKLPVFEEVKRAETVGETACQSETSLATWAQRVDACFV